MNPEIWKEQMTLAGVDSGASGTSPGSKRLHSKYDPWKEARAQLPSDLTSTRTLLVFGAGLGYVVSLLLDAGMRVIWFETDATILSEGLALHDFRESLKNGKLRVHRTLDAEALDEWRLTNENTAFWSHRSFLTPELSAMRAKAEFLLNRQSVNRATLSRFERIWAVNLCANLLKLGGSKRVRELFGIHSGFPAVVIGAGPSLTDSLPALARVRTKAIFVAVDTAVRVLQHAGIDPDYIVTVDPQPVNRVFLEAYRGSARIVLDPTVSYHSAGYASRNPTYIAATPFYLGKLFEDLLQGKAGDVAFGGSVSTNAYDLARKMGCDPVYLVGQDLSFSDGQVHARGAALEERLSWRETRTTRREMHNFAQLTAIPPLVIEDLRGGKVQTNGKLAIFYRWFEARFEADLKAGLRIENCTVRGAHFRALGAGNLQELESESAIIWEKGNGEGGEPRVHSVAENQNALLRSVKQMVARLEDVNVAYCDVWKITDPEKRSDSLDALGKRLRGMPDLELLGNTAQSAIGRVQSGGEGAAEALHHSLHDACLLLLRSLKRVERVLRASAERHS